MRSSVGIPGQHEPQRTHACTPARPGGLQWRHFTITTCASATGWEAIPHPYDAPSKAAAFGHRWALQNTLSEMLGHASVAITLDLYSHFLPDVQADAVATIGQLLSG
jgi:hypothetical protein